MENNNIGMLKYVHLGGSYSTILKKIDANDYIFGTNSEQAFCSVDCVLRCLTVLVDSFSGTMRMTFTNKR